MVKKVFSNSEKRVISAMYQLGRWATANEIADWADGMSWNTAKGTLLRLRGRGIVDSRMVRETRNSKKIQEWKIINFDENDLMSPDY